MHDFGPLQFVARVDAMFKNDARPPANKIEKLRKAATAESMPKVDLAVMDLLAHIANNKEPGRLRTLLGLWRTYRAWHKQRTPFTNIPFDLLASHLNSRSIASLAQVSKATRNKKEAFFKDVTQAVASQVFTALVNIARTYRKGNVGNKTFHIMAPDPTAPVGKYDMQTLLRTLAGSARQTRRQLKITFGYGVTPGSQMAEEMDATAVLVSNTNNRDSGATGIHLADQPRVTQSRTNSKSHAFAHMRALLVDAVDDAIKAYNRIHMYESERFKKLRRIRFPYL